MDEIRKKIGENIRKACKVRGIKQIDIARYMGFSQGTVSNWFNGANSIDIENLAKLCEFIGINLNQAFGTEPIRADLPSSDEYELLELYRSLNTEGKSMLLSTARAFAGNPAMKKSAAVG